jgi:hypothetical protein
MLASTADTSHCNCASAAFVDRHDGPTGTMGVHLPISIPASGIEVFFIGRE